MRKMSDFRFLVNENFLSFVSDELWAVGAVCATIFILTAVWVAKEIRKGKKDDDQC